MMIGPAHLMIRSIAETAYISPGVTVRQAQLSKEVWPLWQASRHNVVFACITLGIEKDQEVRCRYVLIKHCIRVATYQIDTKCPQMQFENNRRQYEQN